MVLFSFGLAACDTIEERADKYYARAAELYAEGDAARAAVELNNAIALVPGHREARLLFAEIEEENGSPAAAYGHFLALTEFNPEDLEAQRQAARLAAVYDDWEAAGRHAEEVHKLMGDTPVSPLIQGVDLAVAYQKSRIPYDPEKQIEVAGKATALVAEHPELRMLFQLLLDYQVKRDQWDIALSTVDAALANHPDYKDFYLFRLYVLDKLGQSDEIEKQLREMTDIFDEDGEANRMLLRWYMSQNRVADAQSYLRQQVAQNTYKAEPQMLLIGFIQQTAGTQAALDEMNAILEGLPKDDPNRPLYRSARAGLVFDLGRRDEAIAELDDILANAKPSDVTRRIKIILAKMQLRLDDRAAAEALIEEVLAEDATETDALKMRALWMIQDDNVEEALQVLRIALDQEPRDAEALTLMAQAHARAGSHGLSGNMLALAVEASGSAPEESIRYADFLTEDGRLLAAESVLVDALRLDSGNLPILRRLGDIYLALQDWVRLRGVVSELNLAGAGMDASRLVTLMLSAQNEEGQLEDFLGGLAARDDNDIRVVATIVRLRLARGDVSGALQFIQSRLAEQPDDPDLRYIAARVFASSGETSRAQEELQKLIAEAPGTEHFWITLYNLTRSVDGAETARSILQDAVKAVPDSRSLAWMQASELEMNGDIDGAITVYERLYEENSDSLIVANNLASLIASYHDDADSLARAELIARRFQGATMPVFQDTYGWIMSRTGRLQEALKYLEPAARALSDDPSVQYHLARTYALAGRRDAAAEAFRTTQALLDQWDGPDFPFEDEVRQEIDTLAPADQAPVDPAPVDQASD
ncbi:MAG: hypothetical protein CML66_28060 [Rhodobacteraceae bacterium]|nr:hypothetical protein [Paracoccaceae bacterium]MAY47684.1 hypothetical protein [Paracoccaceae bacterium]